MNKDFYIDQNTDFESLITIRNPISGEYINIVGAEFSGTIRKGPETRYSSTNIVCEIINTSNSTIKISVANTETANLEQGRHVYDIIMLDSNNKKTKLLGGTIIIIPSTNW